jgi:tetratricopeptide (TPR) repeat protein
MRELVAMDAANADWQQQLALNLADLARVLIARRDCGAATPIVDEGLAISERLADRGADVSNAAKVRLSLGNSRATCLLRSGRGHEAEAVLSRSLALIAEPDETRVDFSARAQLLATSRHLLGLAARDRGQEQEALQHWNAGLALLGPERTDPGYRAIRSLLLKALGRHDEASEIAADLQAQGYAEPAWLASLATLAAQH